MNRKRNPLDETFDEAMDTQACLIEARMAGEEIQRWLDRQHQALERASMHGRGCIGQLERIRQPVTA